MLKDPNSYTYWSDYLNSSYSAKEDQGHDSQTSSIGQRGEETRPQKERCSPPPGSHYVSHVGVGIYIVQDGTFVYTSPLYQKLTGYSDAELTGRNPLDYLHPDDRAAVRKNAVKALKGKSSEPYEYRFIRKNGEVMWVLEMITSIIHKGERASLGSFMDITERKQMEETLRQSEEKYRDIIENIQDGYFENDLGGNFIFFNDSLCAIHGYPREELMGMNNRQYADKENAKKALESFRTIYETGKTGRVFDYEIIRKDGTKRQVEVSASLQKDSSGKPTGFTGITRDITERKEAEEAVRRSEERYRNILESIQEGYFELDLDGKYTFVNEANCRFLGYTKEEMVGMNSRQHMDEETAKKLDKPYRELYLTGTPIELLEVESIRKDGAKVLYETSVSLIRDSKGKPIGFRGVSRNVTDRKKMEQTIRQSEEKYRAIIEQLEDAYFEVDLPGCFTFVNDAECRNLGYSREELIGMDRRGYADEKNSETLYRIFNEVYNTGAPVRAHDLELTKKDGTKASNEISVSLIRDTEGNPVGFRGIARDVTERKAMEERVRQSEERYRDIIENMEDAYFETNLAGNFTFVNDAEAKNLGYTRGELIGMHSRQYTDEKNAEELYGLFNSVYKTGTAIHAYDLELAKKDGAKAFHEISVSLIRDSAGNPAGFRGIARDVTERKAMEERIRQSEEKYRTIIEEMEEWYFETDLAGNILFYNDIFIKGLGYSHKELTGVNFRDFVKQEDQDTAYKTFHQVYETGEPAKNFPYEFIRQDGSTTFIEFSIFPRRDQEGTILGFRGVGHDITERKRTEERIQYLATHDTLTELPNRLTFNQLLNHAIEGAHRYERKLAVFFIDLDRFKIINDTLGHEAGDQLLQEIAVRLRQALRAVDVIARLGGDEFVILIEEVTDLGQVTTVARNVLSSVIKPVMIMGQECRVTASIGISVYPKDGVDGQALMKTADIAMYFAKEEGKNNYQFYSKDIKSQSIERLLIETNLRQALKRKEFSLHYQAKLDFKTGAITGVEALLRWQNPTLGSITPLQFIPVAEETGLIVPIGRWVMKTACAQNVAWQREGLPPVCMAVNLSLRQLTDEALLEDIKAALDDSGMAPNLLELEITESMVMHNPARMIKILSKIKKMDVRLAIDDFGTGYSSLSQIKNFPIDTLKVDRSFIRNLPNDSEDKAITEAIIAMGRTLSLTVVAEGVETQEQMDFLEKHFCDQMQGYYFSKPIIPEQFADLLRTHVSSKKG
ncbi:MAG: PAS domain S-box protein [Syntrophales bacterium]|nr:PAS domain S-box protein [Syntrophales bacterium]